MARSAPRLNLVTAASEIEVNDAFRSAATVRGIECHEIDPLTFDAVAPREPRPIELVYRILLSELAMRVEQTLLSPTVASFYATSEQALFPCFNQLRVFAWHGLPTAKTIQALTLDRPLLHRYADALGGFPVIVKIPGGSGGVGVIRVDSFEALVSLVDYLVARGATHAVLCEYIPRHVQYRLYVIGTRVVCAVRQIPAPDDFRTNRPGRTRERADDFPIDHPTLADLAVRACQVLRIEFGGVDILVDDTGRAVVSEVNFPAVFWPVAVETKVDVAGLMLEYLVDKAARLVR